MSETYVDAAAIEIMRQKLLRMNAIEEGNRVLKALGIGLSVHQKDKMKNMKKKYFIQVGAFESNLNAENRRADLANRLNAFSDKMNNEVEAQQFLPKGKSIYLLGAELRCAATHMKTYLSPKDDLYRVLIPLFNSPNSWQAKFILAKAQYLLPEEGCFIRQE